MLLKALRASVATLLFVTQAHAQFYGSVSLDGGTANPPVPDFSLCAPYANKANHIWYIDPVNGHTQTGGGTGSQASPWNSLSAVVSSVAGYSGPLLSTASGGQNIINPGDEILLMSGNYGDFPITNITNSDWVTIAAAPGQTPVIGQFGSIISGGAHVVTSIQKFAFVGLKIQESTGGARLVDLRDAPGSPLRDVLFDHIVMNSADNTTSWTQAQWRAQTSQGIVMAGSSEAAEDGVSCVTISNSHIYNMFNAVFLGGDRNKIVNTEIDHFTGDAVDYVGDNLLVQYDHFHDRIDDASGIHGDIMQGFIGRASVHDVLIDNVVANYQEDPNLPLYLRAGEPITVSAVDPPQTGITPTCSTATAATVNIVATLPVDPTLIVGSNFELNMATTGGSPANMLTNAVMSVASITGSGPWVVTGALAATACPATISPGSFYSGNMTVSSPARPLGHGIRFMIGATLFTIVVPNANGTYNVGPGALIAPGTGAGTGDGIFLEFTGCIGNTDSAWTRLVVTNNRSSCVQGGANGMAFDNNRDSVIANNTLDGCLSISAAAVGNRNTIAVRNNLVSCYRMTDPLVNGDHNISAGPACLIASISGSTLGSGTYLTNKCDTTATLSSYLTNYNTSTLTYDMTLATGSPAIAFGNAATPSAPRDATGKLRVAPFDVGAYNH